MKKKQLSKPKVFFVLRLEHENARIMGVYASKEAAAKAKIRLEQALAEMSKLGCLGVFSVCVLEKTVLG